MQDHQEVKKSNDCFEGNKESTIRVLGVNIWNGSMDRALTWLVERIHSKKSTEVVFANANNLNIACEQRNLKDYFNQSTRVFADGSGLALAAKMCADRFLENVNGTDMFPLLCAELEKKKSKVFLLGAEPEVLEGTIEKIKSCYPKLPIAGYHHGYFGDDETSHKKIISKINHSSADLLVVAMGTPMQEFWLAKYAAELEAPVKIAVGGLFDFIAEKNSRAPMWMRQSGIEWIWRIIQEPKRMWRRYVFGNPLFVYRILVNHSFKLIQKKIRRGVNQGYSILKRCYDFFGALSVLVLLSPLLLSVAMAIRIDSTGSALFSQWRVGKHGKKFRLWKFRSMVSDAENCKKQLSELNESADSVLFKIKKDPRITRVGRFIRKFSIDELPQLWNVLRGDMSLVGPRPALPDEVKKYSSDDKKRLKVKPGLTCFWQVSGRSELSFKQQVQLDKKYIRERSVWIDLKILLLTIPAVISGKGAY